MDMLGLCTDYCLILSATDAVTLYSFSVAVTHHRQEHSFPDFSLITFKFPDFSMFSRLVATLLLGFKQITTTSLGPFSTTTRISSYHK